MENKYKNGKIYKLWSLETDEIYVGSTCQPLHKRTHKHRCEAQTLIAFIIHKEMNRIGSQTFKIELIENYPCENRNELVKREIYWIRELKATLNMVVAGRTSEEYVKYNYEKTQTYKKNGMKII